MIRRVQTRPVAPLHPALRNPTINADGYNVRYKHLWLLVTEALESDGRWWRHCSVSRVDRTMPTYDDLMTLKRLTIGDDREAYQVFPAKDRHIDIAGKLPRPVQVLHLWSPEEPVLPDFSSGTGSI